jgi:hypothetical protein
MKIVWSHRKTTCSLCREPIERKVQRLDDTIRRNGSIRRLHYHPECYMSHIQGWTEKHPYIPVTSKGGRPSLGLEPNESKRRQQLLANLNSLMGYYFPKNAEPKLNLQGSIETLTPLDLRRFHNFTTRRERIVAELEEIGGLPENYGGPAESTRRRNDNHVA